MVQKLGLAQAILHKPKLLVLDEPLAQLDPASRFQTKNIVRDLAKTGTTVILSSHILSDVQDLATKIAILNRGRIMAIGTLEELMSRFPGQEQQVDIVLSRDSGRWRELESIAGVTSIEQTAPNKLMVHLDSTADIDETLHKVLQGLMTRDCRIRGFNLAIPNLEEVYLRFVGEGGEDT
jgi:ABC-2 type transport system ATP-binding protein